VSAPDALSGEPTEREKALADAIVRLLAWTYGGACSDCTMFRAAPSCIDFVHHHDCGHLEDINKALALLGREREEGHDYDDPEFEMRRLANERTRRVEQERGAAILGGLMGMAEAIRSTKATLPCVACSAPTAAWRKFCDGCE
jgi:hypothetical protein